MVFISKVKELFNNKNKSLDRGNSEVSRVVGESRIIKITQPRSLENVCKDEIKENEVVAQVEVEQNIEEAVVDDVKDKSSKKNKKKNRK